MTECKRPYFGKNQIQYIEELVIGERYKYHYHHGTVDNTGIITIVSMGDYWFRVEYSDSEIVSQSMADHGIIPYGSGKWNQTNWLEKIEEDKMIYEEVELVDEEECGLPKIHVKDIEPIVGALLHFEEGGTALNRSFDFRGLLVLDDRKDWRIVKIKGCLYLAALKKKDC